MYRSHYNLVEKPFQLSTDPRFLWLGEKHKEALATLRYGVIDQKGFLLVAGDVGTGKTTLINALLESIEENTLVASITDPALNLIDFLNLVAASFDIPEKFDNKVDFIVSFSRFLKKVYSENKNVLLIIDEVHSLSKELLEHIRLLSNIELPEEKLISIFFVGQNEINQTLALPECRALRQRISLIYQIEPLSESETFEYIKHRLKVAGTEKALFHKKAVEEIYRFSNGYPRLINTICDLALLTGYARDLKKIPPSVIQECCKQFRFIGQAQKSSLSIAPKQHDIEPRSHIMKHPTTVEVAPVAEPLNERDVQDVASAQSESSQKHSNPEEKINISSVNDDRSPALKYMGKKHFRWGLAVSLAVMFMLFTGLYQKDISLKKNHQKLENSTLKAPVSFSIEPDHHFIPPAHAKKIDTASPVQPNKASFAGKSKQSKSNTLELAKKALKNKNFSYAIELFENVIARNPADTSTLKVYYSKALAGQADIVATKDPDKAKILLHKAVNADPKNVKAHFDLGRLYFKSKEYSKAISAYQKAANLKYRSPDAFYNLGFIYAATGDFANAESMFILAANQRPNYLDKILFNLAAVQQQQGKTQQCVENLEKALKINPKNQRAKEYLSQFKKT